MTRRHNKKIITMTIVLVAVVTAFPLLASANNFQNTKVASSPALKVIDFVDDYAESTIGKLGTIKFVETIESPITGYGLDFPSMSQGKILFNGWTFDIGGGVAGGQPVPHDGRVYTHVDFPDIYLFEAVVEAGEAIKSLEVGDEVWVDSRKYVVKDFIPSYFEQSEDGQSVVYYPGYDGKMNGWDYDLFFQTCTSKYYWPCPIDIWLLDESE